MENKSVPNHPFPIPPLPSDHFFSRPLPKIESQGTWYRLNPVGYQSALFFDTSGKGRFDQPDQGYGILYVGEDEHASFIESFCRDRSVRKVAAAYIKQRNLFAITASRPLVFVDLTGSGLVRVGADANLLSSDYNISRAWGKAIWQHPDRVDGIRYHSRLDPSRFCCSLFDRSKEYLQEENLGNLVDHHPVLLSEIVENYDYSVLRDD